MAGQEQFDGPPKGNPGIRERSEAVFVAVPERVRPTESDYEVADARVENQAVQDVLRFAIESGLIGEGQSSLAEVAQALETTYGKYSGSSSPEGKEVDVLVAEYRAWLESSEDAEAKKVLAYVKSLRTTLKKIELLGLTRQELEGSKAQIYGSVLRARLNVEPEFLRALVEGAPDDAAVAKKEPVKKPAVQPVVQAAIFPKVTAAGLVNY